MNRLARSALIVLLVALLLLAFRLLDATTGTPGAEGDPAAEPAPARAAALPDPGALRGAESGAEPPPPSRSAAADAQDPSAMRLRVEVVDPLDLLARDHQLVASGAGGMVCRRWRRAGALLVGEWEDETAPPLTVEYFIEPLRPPELLAAAARFTADPEGGWRARLDLSDAVALVELVVGGDYPREVRCSLKANFRFGGVEGVLDMIENAAAEPLIVVAPAPCTILVELDDRSNSQYAQKTFLPIPRGGRHRFEIPAATGSVRVRIHEPAGSASKALENYHLELWSDLARGGHQARRLSSASTGGDTEFTLVPPGRYELYCWVESDQRRLIGGRVVEVGAGETLVEFRSPTDDRTLRVRHAAAPGTEFWLLRPGVAFDSAPRGALAGDDGLVVFEGLVAAEWLVWARGPGGVAIARADLRAVRDAETELGDFLPLVPIEIVAEDFPPGSAELLLTESSGRLLRPGLRAPRLGGPEPPRCQINVLPGLLRIRALHSDGWTAEDEVLIPRIVPASGVFSVVLKFRAP